MPDPLYQPLPAQRLSLNLLQSVQHVSALWLKMKYFLESKQVDWIEFIQEKTAKFLFLFN
jgi:hypothetical protein